MGFSDKQLRALKRNVDHRYVRTRESNGRELSYIEGWYAISQANQIFGLDGWSRETVEARCILTRENRGTFLAVYLARVRITVQADGTTIIREGHGTGEGRGTSAGEAHDMAVKAAETDATKRALATFGRSFGLELYRKSAPKPPQLRVPAPRVGFHPDDTTPIPRPSRYYGGGQHVISTGGEQKPSQSAPSIVPAQSARVDKSALMIAKPKRLRDKNHLKFVATQPCLVCGRQPSDPHHLQFAQPRALGMKVSDEFTVPLCRGHHRQLHQFGNEVGWWENLKIEALSVAKRLWDESHAGRGHDSQAQTADT